MASTGSVNTFVSDDYFPSDVSVSSIGTSSGVADLQSGLFGGASPSVRHLFDAVLGIDDPLIVLLILAMTVLAGVAVLHMRYRRYFNVLASLQTQEVHKIGDRYSGDESSSVST